MSEGMTISVNYEGPHQIVKVSGKVFPGSARPAALLALVQEQKPGIVVDLSATELIGFPTVMCLLEAGATLVVGRAHNLNGVLPKTGEYYETVVDAIKHLQE